MESGENIESEKRFNSFARREVLIDGTVRVKSLGIKSFSIDVGNTGLAMKVVETEKKYTIRGDFLPGGYDGNNLPISKKDAIKMFCFGLMSFRDWVKNTKEIDTKKMDYMSSIANPKFKQFLEKLFLNNGHSELIKSDFELPEDPRKVRVDVRKLLELPDTDPLIRKIYHIGNLTKGTIVPAIVRT